MCCCGAVARAARLCRDEEMTSTNLAKKLAGEDPVLRSVPPSLSSSLRCTPEQVEAEILRKVEARSREPAAQYREGTLHRHRVCGTCHMLNSCF